MAPENSVSPQDWMAQRKWNPAAVCLCPALRTIPPAASMPNVLSDEYDLFSAYGDLMPGPYSHEIYDSYPRTPPPALAISRSPDFPLRRASFKAYPPIPASPAPTTPRVKAETPSEYENTESCQHSSPRITNAPHATSISPYPPLLSLGQSATQPSSGYASDGAAANWTSRGEYPVGPDELYLTASSQSPTAIFGQQDARRPTRIGSRAARRTPRKLTTKAEANFQCDVNGCGKLFSRSYNFKAHMETHDDKREYHFPCQMDACTKKFVRKTDLQRHHQSVHAKERTHRCEYCARMFARKDTLRRHMDDGCSKRFDIGILDLLVIPDEQNNRAHIDPAPTDDAALDQRLVRLESNYSWGR